MARRNASDLETFQRRAVCSSERTVSTSSAKVDLIVILAISFRRYGHIRLGVKSPHGCCPHGCWARRNECCRRGRDLAPPTLAGTPSFANDLVMSGRYGRMVDPPKGSFFLFGVRGVGKSTWARTRLP